MEHHIISNKTLLFTTTSVMKHSGSTIIKNFSRQLKTVNALKLFYFNLTLNSALKHQSRLQQTTFINIFSLFFSEKIRLDVSSESSARQRIHMKFKSHFLQKSIKIKVSSAAIFVWRLKG